ncbi:hypothetical protein [Burkholderia cenocepacia]
MANAERKEAVTEIRVIEPARITLSLSDEEATFLVDVFANIGGSRATRRKHADDISTALYRAGVRGLPRDAGGCVPDISKSQGVIYFEQV